MWDGSTNMNAAIVSAGFAGASALFAGSAVYLSIRTARQQRLAAQAAYVVLALTLERANKHRLIAHTSLENRSIIKRALKGVVLIVCPADEDPLVAANALLPKGHVQLEYREQLVPCAPSSPLRDCQRLWMLLDYYTFENIQVGDEILTYDEVIDVTNFRENVAYSVRLILDAPDRLHRVVHRAFVR